MDYLLPMICNIGRGFLSEHKDHCEREEMRNPITQIWKQIEMLPVK